MPAVQQLLVYVLLSKHHSSVQAAQAVQPASASSTASQRTRGQAVEERELKRDVIGEAQRVAHLQKW